MAPPISRYEHLQYGALRRRLEQEPSTPSAKDIMDMRTKIGAEQFDIHSLRYTATAELARVGLDDAAIMSITGHKTAKMVQLYAGEERQKSRAKAANKAREQNKSRM